MQKAWRKRFSGRKIEDRWYRRRRHASRDFICAESAIGVSADAAQTVITTRMNTSIADPAAYHLPARTVCVAARVRTDFFVLYRRGLCASYVADVHLVCADQR